MSRTDNSTRFDGLHNHGADGTQPLESGVLSQDFPKRLERLKEASGLSWRGFAKSLGVDPKQLRRWRKKGVEPSGTHALPRPLRKQHPRRHGDPHGRGLPDDFLQGGELDQRPRRAHGATAARRGRN